MKSKIRTYPGVEWNDNMDVLYKMSRKLSGFERHLHPGLFIDASTTTLKGIDGDPMKMYEWHIKEFGHCVLGKYQFLYTKNNKVVSVIRSGVSFGFYEVLRIRGGKDDPTRFMKAADTLKHVMKLLK